MTFNWADLCQCNVYVTCGVHKIEEYIDKDFCDSLINSDQIFEETYE